MSDPGVVDRIRVPAWLREPVERTWREMPTLARVFVSLTALDIVVRSLGLLSPIGWAYVTPLSFVSAFLPHDLWILLPALLILRRPDAETATPLILWGSVALAGQEVAGPALTSLLGYGTAGLASASLVVGIVATGARIAGWALLARGLATLNPREPSENVAGMSNLAAAAVGLLVVLGLVDLVTARPIATGSAGLDQLYVLNGLALALAPIAWAYLLWVVLRGLGDRRRPEEATLTAGIGAVLAAFLGLVVALAVRILSAGGPNGSSSLQEIVSILEWFAATVGPSLIALGFAVGLAEPPMPYLAPVTPAPAATVQGQSDAAEPPDEAPPVGAEPPTPDVHAGPSTPEPPGPFAASADEEPAILPE